MASRFFVWRATRRLEKEYSAERESGDPQEWASRDPASLDAEIRRAELLDLAKAVLPTDSTTLAMLKSRIGSENPDSLRAEGLLLERIVKWNWGRTDDNSMEDLAKEINSTLSRNLLKHPVVKISLALLVASVGFAIFGAIQFQGMKFDAAEKIREKRDQVLGNVQYQEGETLKRFAGISAEADAQRRKVDDLKTALETSTSQLEKVAEEDTRALHRWLKTKVEETTKDLDSAVKRGREDISSAASKRAYDLKTLVPGEFEKGLEDDVRKLNQLNRDLKDQESRVDVVQVALRELSGPSHTFFGQLAGAFRQTILVVYGVLGILVAILLLNVFLVVSLFRRRHRA